ncbi:MAG: hypothetical protein CMP24_01485 [Rickettsiales bacterium]|nr:hypothetical protein [Rickettsiales bacterium]
MIKYNQVKKILKDNVTSIKKTELISLDKATNRYLATEIKSKFFIPPKDNSAVDGFIFNYKQYNISKNKNFVIKGEINAGETSKSKIDVNSFLRISTGGQTPSNLDTVVMQENVVTEKNNIVSINGLIKKGMNVRKKGEDIKKGQLVFSKGHKLRPQDIGMLASLGISRVKVVKKIKIGILSNGNELIEPGKKKKFYQIYDSNRYMLKSFLNKESVDWIDFKIVKDKESSVLKKIKNAKKKCDVLVITGGASTGKKDFMSYAIKEIGTLNFWKVSIKPGRPFGFGILPINKPTLMIPGNPVASFTIFFLFGRFLINHMLGNNNFSHKSFKVKSNFVMKKKKGREEFLRARIFYKNNTMYVNKFKTQGAGILNSLVWADGLVKLDEEKERIKKNEFLEFFPFEV